MPKIRVLHIITRLDKGGSAYNTLLTVSRLDKAKYETVLMSGVTNDPDAEIAGFTARENIDYIFVPQLVREINLLRDAIAFCKIFRFIKKGKFDIVHTHTSKAGILGRWAAKLAGVKIIVHTPHGHIFYGYFGRFKTKFFIFLETITARITDKIITLTQVGKDEHIKFGIAPGEKFIPVYSGIEIERFINFKPDSDGEKKKLNILPGIFVIGTVSRLDPVKGNRYFIFALPAIVKVFPGLKAVFVGEGSEKEQLISYTRELGIYDNVIFTGERQDVRGLMCAFDIFVLSSLNEGMGRCLLEAQALGLPVVATEIGGVPEVIKNGLTGILVPPADPEALSAAIISLLKDEARRLEMGREAKKWVDNRFSVEAMVNKISELYEGLICR